MKVNEILVVEELKKYFPIKEGFIGKPQKWVSAVDGVTFGITEGEFFGCVGESGCGKTTLARTILRLIEPTSGKAYFRGKDIFKMSSKELKNFRSKAQIIFQDPYTSLDPRMTVEQIIGEALVTQKIADKEGKEARIRDIVEKVGLKREDLHKYPHEFSGGQRQRIAIARALVVQPEFVVLDEPTSALDVSVRAQILNLITSLRQELNLTGFFISHDLGVISHSCDRVAVMYLGKIIEMGSVDEFFKSPNHPYSKALISAIPSINPENTRKIILKGEVPSSLNPPSGCRFHPRCQYSKPICKEKEPKLTNIDRISSVACYLYQ
jgi:oligopeptide/dipeptide ABC transporter ATP-binding protein